MSSNLVGLDFLSKSLIPGDSNWKTPIVFALEKVSYVLLSVREISPNWTFSFLFEFISLIVWSRIVNVVKPRKSNFTNPIFSTSSLSNCEVNGSLSPDLNNGQKSSILPGAINTPPAWIPAFLVKPSSFFAYMNNSFVSSSESILLLKISSSFTASSNLIWRPGMKGINFAISSTFV